MEDIQRLRLQYVAVIEHQVFHLHIISNQLIRGRLRWRRGARVRRILRRPKMHMERSVVFSFPFLFHAIFVLGL